jgi:hypothetical protein
VPQVSPLRPRIPINKYPPAAAHDTAAPPRARNVVAKTESPRAKPVLAVSRRNPLQFLDRVFNPTHLLRPLRSLPNPNASLIFT